MSFDEILDKIGHIIAEYEEDSGNIISCRIFDIHNTSKGDAMWWCGHSFAKGRLDRITDEQYKLLKGGGSL